MNDAMSLGVHRLWKDSFISFLDPGSNGPIKALDMAGGTGDISHGILDYARIKYYDRETHVTVSDVNPDMLEQGRRRFKQTMYHNSRCTNGINSYLCVSRDWLTMFSPVSFTGILPTGRCPGVTKR